MASAWFYGLVTCEYLAHLYLGIMLMLLILNF